MIELLLDDPDKFIGSDAVWQLIPCYWADIPLPLETLAPLFEAPDERVTSQALYIISEVGPRACHMYLDQVLELTQSDKLKVRLMAYMCIVVGAIQDRKGEIKHVFEGLLDEDHHVVSSNLSYLSGLHHSRLQAILPLDRPPQNATEQRLQWLLELPEEPEVGELIKVLMSEDPLTRRIGAIAAARKQELYPRLLDVMAGHTDGAIAGFGKQQVKIARIGD